jgi:2-keto-3-deoxy-L-rhamnonate aldolase RhmA
MKEYTLKKAIREEKILFGMSIKTPAPNLLEIIGYSGFDFIYVDMEHSTINLESLSEMVLAADLSGLAILVRVSDNNPPEIRKVLEIGAEGVIVPHVNNREEALRAVQAARFTPDGKRGFHSLVRSSSFNMPPISIEEYTRLSNDGVSLIVQVEEKQAIENIEEITNVRGIDVVLLGPSDLSLSIGLPGQFQSPEIIKAIDKVIETAKKKGIPIMCSASYLIQPVSVENITALVDKGLRLLLLGSVEGIIRQACIDKMENIVKKIH